jgi:hypothetical protein
LEQVEEPVIVFSYVAADLMATNHSLRRIAP